MAKTGWKNYVAKNKELAEQLAVLQQQLDETLRKLAQEHQLSS